MHCKDEDGGIQRILAIYCKFLQALHHLCLLHDHKLTLCKHGISAGRGYDCICIDICTVAHGLIEIPLALVKAMFQNGIAHHIDIIRLISHQKINRFEDACTSILHNLPA